MKKKEKLKKAVNPLDDSRPIEQIKLTLDKNIITTLTHLSESSRDTGTRSVKWCECPNGSFTLPCPVSRHALCTGTETWEHPYCTLA